MIRLRRALRHAVTPTCGCEPPETWLAAYRENMIRNQTESVTLEEVNRFWDYRLRCGQRTCRSASTLTHATVGRYLPLKEADCLPA